ncbi:MAG: hypothetical protein H7Y07_10400 [Pyrinomonadaceae bacterium]|nr:hypothetical protein [Sphingobacteriaceae bacterium]
MDLNEMNENWQKEAPLLAAMEKKNPFTVADGYFPKMEEQLQQRIKISEFDNNQPLFTVPENYFETLSENILSLTRLEQIEETSDSKVFTVPENYFLNLEEQIAKRLGIKETAVVQPKIKPLFSSWLTYAAAACITAVIGFGIYFNTANKDIETQIAQLPSEEIDNYLQLYSDAGDAAMIVTTLGTDSEVSELIPEVSEQEIKEYLELNL